MVGRRLSKMRKGHWQKTFKSVFDRFRNDEMAGGVRPLFVSFQEVDAVDDTDDC